MNVEYLIIAAVISAMPTIAIGIIAFAFRRGADLSSLVASKDAIDKILARIESELREERDKRDQLEKIVYEMPGKFALEYLHREDHVRHCAQVDTKLETLYRNIESLRPKTS